jgi:hypothetical protein
VSPVESFIAAMEPPAAREAVAALRRLVLAAHEGVTEHIKWNGPSFCIDGDDRITLGLDRSGAVRVVLHRGVRVKDATDFHFEDEDGLVKWAARDRGVVMFNDRADVETRAAAFSRLANRWIEATRD